MNEEKNYTLITWPDIQNLMELSDFNDKCKPVIPSGNSELENAYMVPLGFHGMRKNSGDNYRQVGWPESQKYIGKEPGALADYEGHLYVPEEHKMINYGYELTYVRKPGRKEKEYSGANSSQIIDYIMEQCFIRSELWREKAYAVYIDRKLKIVGHLLLSVGSDTATIIEPKLVVKGALDTMAISAVLCHNHPTGDPTPSEHDKKATESVQKALRAFGLSLLDHVIIGYGNYFSFQEERIIENDKI